MSNCRVSVVLLSSLRDFAGQEIYHSAHEVSSSHFPIIIDM